MPVTRWIQDCRELLITSDVDIGVESVSCQICELAEVILLFDIIFTTTDLMQALKAIIVIIRNDILQQKWLMHY